MTVIKVAGPKLGLALALGLSWAQATESLFTVRLGEQDTSRHTAVTTLRWDARKGVSHIRFDVSALRRNTVVCKALLRFWLEALDPNAPLYTAWGFPRWREAGFDGFKVWDGTEPSPRSLLDTRYPFNTPTYWCMEFDVTKAVARWVADPRSNRGLTTNFQFPVAPDGRPEVAWQRPYLEVTCVGPNPHRPRQPTNLRAFYRSGQVFLTWRQIPHDGAFFDSTYRVYRHEEPITAENLHEATLLGEVHRLSQLNYRRTMTARGGDYGPWKYYVAALGHETYRKGESHQERMRRILPLLPQRFNFVIDDTWPRRIEGGRFLDRPKPSERVQVYQGPQLSDETGLFVHTVGRPGRAFYAVTSVVEGNENRQDFSAENSLREPVAQKAETPRPVLQAVFTANGPEGYRKVGKFQIREYAYWGDKSLHCEPSTPFCFTFHVPRRWVGLGRDRGDDRAFPPWVLSLAKVAGYSVSYWNGRGIVMDTAHIPPTRLAPFPPAGTSNMLWRGYGRYYYGSRKPPTKPPRGPVWLTRDVYGYLENINSGEDPRTATVRPYLENRRVFELRFVLENFPADPNFVWAAGEGSTLNFAVHHADLIACAKLEQERPWKSPRGAPPREVLVGLKEWGLKNELGYNVWDWNDPLWFARKFPEKEWPFMSLCHSDNYDASDNWGAFGHPAFLLGLAATRRMGELWWCDIGDAPSGKFQAVPRNQPYPVFTNVTCAQTPREDWRDEPRGTLNGYIVWHRATRPFLLRVDNARLPRGATPPPGRPIPYRERWGGRAIHWAALPLDLIDQADRLALTLRISDVGLVLNGQDVPPCRSAFGATDVTLRRPQRFRPEKGRRYLWKNFKASTGQLLQAGIAVPDPHGVLTIPGVFVDKDLLGNRLVIEPAAGREPPSIEKNQRVPVAYYRTMNDRRRAQKLITEELNYGEYLRRCRQPELVPTVRPGKVFVIDDFLNARGFRGNALYSMWGGGFEDAFHFPQGGLYRIEVRTTRSYCQHGAWPILGLFVDSRPVGERYLDSEAEITRTWWVNLAAGRHTLRFWLMNNVFNEPVPRHGDQDPRPDRGFSLVRVRFVRLGPQPARPAEPHDLAVSPRRVTTCPGLPIRFRLLALDGWGRPTAVAPQWQTSPTGASITPDGLFSATKPGSYRVVASVEEKRAEAVATVAEAWREDFDDEWPDGWRAVELSEAPERQSRWLVSRHHGFIGALTQRNLDQKAEHLMIWEGGDVWDDIRASVQCLPRQENLPEGPAWGLVFRCQDARNHCRLEVARQGERVACRLVKVVDGRATELASGEWDLARKSFTRASYPSFRRWSDRWRNRREPFAADVLEVVLRRAKIVAKLNDREIFSVSDSTFEKGTIGLWCRGGASFDNLRVEPIR